MIHLNTYGLEKVINNEKFFTIYNHFKFVNTLRFFKKSAYYSAIQIYNKLPDYIKLLCFEHKYSSFKNFLKKFLLSHTFYSMDDNDGQMIFGDHGGLKLPDICLTGKEKPRKNLTQETCPNRGSNPGPLRDKRACCHMLHSAGLMQVKKRTNLTNI